MLRGRGVPQVQGRGRGDLRVVVNVEVPTKLSARPRASSCVATPKSGAKRSTRPTRASSRGSSRPSRDVPGPDPRLVCLGRARLRRRPRGILSSTDDDRHHLAAGAPPPSRGGRHVPRRRWAVATVPVRRRCDRSCPTARSVDAAAAAVRDRGRVRAPEGRSARADRAEAHRVRRRPNRPDDDRPQRRAVGRRSSRQARTPVGPRIIREAAMQSRRVRLPVLEPLSTFDAVADRPGCPVRPRLVAARCRRALRLAPDRPGRRLVGGRTPTTTLQSRLGEISPAGGDRGAGCLRARPYRPERTSWGNGAERHALCDSRSNGCSE